nr:tryptophan 7-halogenase [Sphingomonas elodea]
MRTDIAIIGGGPAGSAAALTLRQHAPGLEVLMLEAGHQNRPTLGEVLPAVAQGLLRQIGVWPRFQAAGFLPGRALASAWSTPWIDERHSLFSAQGTGWHLDRPVFDRLLTDAAADAGTIVRRGTPVRTVSRAGENWRLDVREGTIEARFVLWATGRHWGLARNFQATLHLYDRLAAFARFFDAAPGEGRMTIEARPEGWWYTADLPGARRVVACLTDADLGRSLRGNGGWYAALAETRHIRVGLGDDARETAQLVRSAATALLRPSSGPGWIAAGDTLFAADPLSSRGITHALRSGILAAYAASDMLAGEAERAADRYARIAAHGIAGYAEALGAHYAAAAQWDTPFWQRRAPPPPMHQAAQ